jgi:hypothetical protein
MHSCLIHHKGWGAEDRPRGSSALYAGVDAQILCSRLPDNYSTALTVQKLKDGPTDLRLTAHLRQVVIDLDEDDGDEITSLIVDSIEDGIAAREERKSKAPVRLTAPALTALKALKTTLKAKGNIPEPCGEIPASTKVVSVDKWREQAIKAGISDARDEKSQKKAFTRAYDRLIEAGKISTWSELAWAS